MRLVYLNGNGATDAVKEAIDAFLAARPYYTREHVIDIASFTVGAGIPFCTVHNDWHNVDEEHSTT